LFGNDSKKLVFLRESGKRKGGVAAITGGRYVGTAGKAIGTDTFGLSAPGDVVMKELGITKEAIVNAAKAL